MAIRIRELTFPNEPGGTCWEDFVAAVELGNAVLRADIGGDDLDQTPEAVLALVRSPYATRRTLVAYHGDEPVGRADLSKEHGQSSCWVEVGVLPAHRGRGIGGRLAEMIMDLARDTGATILHSGSHHSDFESEPRLPSPTGVGSIPAEAAATRFLRRHGFTLGQVEIQSALELPVPDERLEQLTSSWRPAPDYRLHAWIGNTPDEFVEVYARLRTIATTAVPTGDLTEEEQVWDADRVRERDRRNEAAGTTVISTVAQHLPSGEFVAFSNLAFPTAADGRAVGQGYTMVLPEHRGHNLGLRVKINNLRLLAEQQHGARRIVTGNAGENDAMLSINRALGFRPAWISGWWERPAP